MSEPDLTHVDFHVNGVRLHAVTAGPATGPLVVLLHGFPDFWFTWRHQIGPLADAGFRVVAPDQRGYNKSEQPRGLYPYGIDQLSEDIVALVRHLGYERAHIVGHDWGGAVAWWMALQHPTVVDRLAVLNCPHPVVFRRALLRPRQIRKSWYMLLFQLPILPERLLRKDDYARLASVFRTMVERPLTAEELARYRTAWSRSSLTGMLNYYRAALRLAADPMTDRIVHSPTQVFWGTGDPILDRAMAEESLALCEQGSIQPIDGGHFPHLDRPDDVSNGLVSHLTSG